MTNEVDDALIDLLNGEKYEDVINQSQMLPTPEARYYFFLAAREGLLARWIKKGLTKNLGNLLVDHQIFSVIQLQEAYKNDKLQFLDRPYHLKQIRKILRRYDILPLSTTRLCNLGGPWTFCPKCGRQVSDHEARNITHDITESTNY